MVAVCDDWALIVEVRTRLRPEDVSTFAETMGGARAYFPEYAQKKLIGAVGTLSPDPSIVALGDRLGFVVLGMGHDLLEPRNSEGFQPRLF